MFFKIFHRYQEDKWKTILLHSSLSLALASFLSYFFGFLRDRCFAHMFGLSRELDIYNAVFVIPDLLLSILIGAMLSASFIPIFTENYEKNKKLAYKYANQIISWGLLTVFIVAFIIAIFAPFLSNYLVPGFSDKDKLQYINLLRIMLFSPLIFTISNVYGRMLLSIKEFLWYGLSPALYNIGIIFGVLVFYKYIGLTGLILGNILGAFLHLFIRLIIFKNREFKFKFRLNFTIDKDLIESIKLTAPKILQYAMWHFMLISFTSIASNLEEGSISAYNYARNFMSLPVSMIGIAIALAMYTSLSSDSAKGNFKNFKKDFNSNRIKSIIYTSISAITLAIIAKPLINLLLAGGNMNTKSVDLLTKVLQVYCIAIPLESLLHIYHRAFYSLKNTVIPSFFHMFNIVFIIILAKELSIRFSIFALPISFSIGTGLHVLLLAIVFPFVFKSKSKAIC